MNIHKWIYNLKVSVFVRNTNHENMLSSNSNKKNLLSLRLLYFLISIAIILISLYRLRLVFVNLYELNRIIFDIYFLFLFIPENVNITKNITMKFVKYRETIRNTIQIDDSYLLRFTFFWNFLKNQKKITRNIGSPNFRISDSLCSLYCY